MNNLKKTLEALEKARDEAKRAPVIVEAVPPQGENGSEDIAALFVEGPNLYLAPLVLLHERYKQVTFQHSQPLPF